MSTPQWVTTLSLALEIPFDSTEKNLWSNLLSKHVKFIDIFITTLTTIDIVRLPFIDYSFIKWFTQQSDKNKESIFTTIQMNFQIHLRKRVLQELLSLQKIFDGDEAWQSLKSPKGNLSKLNKKVSELSNKNRELNSLKTIVTFLQELDVEIKELEEKGLTEDSEE